MYARGWSDGLPLVPPTEERVLRMLDGSARDPQEVLGLVPPALAAATVEKIAINAVMAGCKPEYLRLYWPRSRRCSKKASPCTVCWRRRCSSGRWSSSTLGPAPDRHERKAMRWAKAIERTPQSAVRCSSSSATSARAGRKRSTAPPSATPASSAIASPRTRRVELGVAGGRARSRTRPVGGDGVRRLRAAGHRRPEVARPERPGAQLRPNP